VRYYIISNQNKLNSVLSKRQSVVFVRYISVVLLSFFLSHYLNYQKLPFTPGYEFPLRTFIFVIIFGIFICESNAFIYRYLKETRSYNNSLKAIIGQQFIYSAVVTIIIFSTLYIVINLIVFDNPFSFFSFTKFLLIIIAIALFEDIILTFRDILKLYNASLSKFDNSNKVFDKILVQQGNNTIEFDTEELAYLHSENGVVTILDQYLNEYTTQYNSLNEIEEKLPPTIFFRINRQYFVNRNIIKSIKKDKNRKLKVILDKPYQKQEGYDGLNVSRYKSMDFKKWYLVSY
jgi:hypothetical protein